MSDKTKTNEESMAEFKDAVERTYAAIAEALTPSPMVQASAFAEDAPGFVDGDARTEGPVPPEKKRKRSRKKATEPTSPGTIPGVPAGHVALFHKDGHVMWTRPGHMFNAVFAAYVKEANDQSSRRRGDMLNFTGANFTRSFATAHEYGGEYDYRMRFEELSLQGANFTDVLMERATFHDCGLSHASFRGAKLSNIHFVHKTDLSCVDFGVKKGAPSDTICDMTTNDFSFDASQHATYFYSCVLSTHMLRKPEKLDIRSHLDDDKAPRWYRRRNGVILPQLRLPRFLNLEDYAKAGDPEAIVRHGYRVEMYDGSMTIGCQRHTYDEWFGFDRSRICLMDDAGAIRWWIEAGARDVLMALAIFEGRWVRPVDFVEPNLAPRRSRKEQPSVAETNATYDDMEDEGTDFVAQEVR